MDFDPRDYDSRDDERHVNSSRGGSGGSTDDRDSDDDWRQPDVQPCDRNDADARTLGRGPGNDRQGSDEHARHRDDPRSGEREREHRERDRDERNPLTRHLYLPRGLERELVRDRGRDYTLRGSETRTLVRFEWSPVVTFASTTIDLPIRAPATSATSASSGSSRPSASLVPASMRWCLAK